MNDLGFIHLYAPPTGGDTLTLLMLHGTGGDERSLLPLGASLRPTAGILSPKGRVLENGMPRFFRRFAEGVFDLEDLKLQTSELARFLRDAATEYEFDPNRVIAVGYSNGANIAASVLLSHAEALTGAVLFRATLPYEPANPPEADGKEILVCAGAKDPFAPRDKVERLIEVLEAGGASVTAHWHPGGHELSSSEVEVASEWMQRF